MRPRGLAGCVIAVCVIASCAVAAACQGSSRPPASASPAPGEPTYLVIYRAGPRWPTNAAPPAALGEHFRYLLSLHRRGALRLAGPFGAETGGAAVLTAPSDVAARELVEADPAVAAQIFAAELRRWSLVDWRSTRPHGASDQRRERADAQGRSR